MSRPPDGYAIGPALALFALTALAIGVAWWWLGAPVALPPSPLAPGEKLYCVSYAPFRDGQDPLVEGTHVEPAQIDEDLALLSKYTDCVRTYSVANGLDKIPEIAQRYGLKVLHGIWLSSNAEKNRQQIATTIELAKKFPDVIRAIIVGNEVLLRGEMSATDLMAAIREVKAKVPEPVTYADVWEYWLRYRDVQNAVDFVTIHILPYWEDFPLPASLAAAHVDAIRKQVAAAIPNKEIVIGEIGWPSAGRMREGARPSPSNQARVIEETLALAKRENFRVNVIEAFDQPWKRWLEGSVGGHWGIFDRATGAPKFSISGGAVSDHPHWLIQALAGILLTAAVFGGAFAAAREKGKAAPPLFVGENRGARVSSRRPVRLDDRDGSGGKFYLGRLAALAGVRGDRRGRADRLRHSLRRGPAAADILFAAWPHRRAPRCAELGARRHLHRARSSLRAGRARSRVRSALPRHSICAAERRPRAFPGLVVRVAASGRITCYASRDGRDGCRFRARRIGGLHRAQRKFRQLAGGLVLRRAASALRLFWRGRGTRQTENEHAGRQRREVGVMQHDAKPGRRERKRRSARAKAA